MGIRPVDVVLAIALTAVACSDVSAETTRSVPLALAGTIVAGSTLALHRELPWLPAAALLAVNLGLGAAVPADERFPPQTLLFPLLVAVYLLATRVAGRVAWLAGAATLALTVAGHVVTPDGTFADFWPLVTWGGPWLAGRIVRRVTLDATARVADAESARERASREAAAAERDRIARELHDVVAHAVSVMVVRAGGQRLRVAGTDPEAAAAFGDIEHAGREALTELRAMLHVLRDPSLAEADDHEPLPDAAGIPALVEQVRRTGRDIRLTSYDVPPDLPAGVALAAHRVVQECLTNALRHGEGPVELAVATAEDALRITVANAIELGAASSPGAGRGLAGMGERVRVLGGALSAGPRDGRWYVEATLPVPA